MGPLDMGEMSWRALGAEEVMGMWKNPAGYWLVEGRGREDEAVGLGKERGTDHCRVGGSRVDMGGTVRERERGRGSLGETEIMRKMWLGSRRCGLELPLPFLVPPPGPGCLLT